MKTLTIIILLFAFTVSAQDSTKINVNIQARDLEYIAAKLPFTEEFESAYDAAKVKFRVANPPTGNTNVAIDSVMVLTWLEIITTLQRDYIAVGASVYSRVDAVLRAKNNVWLNSRLDFYISDATSHYTNLRALGRKRLTKK